MEQRVSLWEAGRHFEALVRRVVSQKEPVLIEWEEGPPVVLLSYDEYLELRAATRQPGQEEALQRLLKVGAAIRAARGGEPLPSPEEVLRELREERLAQLTGLR